MTLHEASSHKCSVNAQYLRSSSSEELCSHPKGHETLRCSLSTKPVPEHDAKIGFNSFRGVVDGCPFIREVFTGESVLKDDVCGGGSVMVMLLVLPRMTFGGEVLGWRIDLSGERPLDPDEGGLKMISSCGGDGCCVLFCAKIPVLELCERS